MRFNLFSKLSLVGVSFALMPYASADISGKVFRDFNANGSLDVVNSFNETGVAGITVKAFDSTGAQVASTLSTTNGDYTLTGVTGALRIEFTGLLAGDVSSPHIAGDGSNLRFVTAPATNVNYGLYYPANYCQADPAIAVPVQYAGDGTGGNANLGGIHTFPYSTRGRSSSNNLIALTKAQVGGIWGLAYDRVQERLFQAPFLKRHVGLKDGLADIYIATRSGSTLTYTSSFNLQGVVATNTGAALDFGSVCRSAACANDAGNTGIATDYVIPPDPANQSIDLDSFAKVAKVGMGGLEMAPDNRYLWAVNLYQRSLVRMDTSLANSALPGSVQSYNIIGATGAPVCTGGEFRPFALTFYRDQGYLGGVCDASISKRASDLQAYVLSFNPQASALSFATVANFNLNYNRGGNTTNGSVVNYKQWHPWLDTWSEYGIPPASAIFNAVPVLSDIAFSDNGGMTLAFMDRFAQQVGNQQYLALTQSTQGTSGRSYGDLVHFCKDSSGGFQMEGSVLCPVNFGGGEGVSGTGEYFMDMGGDANAESALGSILYFRGTNEMVTTLFDPFSPSIPNYTEDLESIETQGLHWLNATNGGRVGYFKVASGYSPFGGFGKGSGMGELEVLCDQPAIEVGNRVWLDTDKDGIQDAGEAGLSGINVSLTCPSGTATTTTDTKGQFIFTNTSGGNAGFLKVDEGCSLRVDNTQTALAAYQLTARNADGDSTNQDQTDIRDSDATVNTGFAELAFTVGAAGANNHSLDFGYREPIVSDIALAKTVAPLQAKHGEQIVYTLTVTNQSTTDATNVQIADQLPAEVVYVSDDGLAQYGSDVFDESMGIWSVGSLAAGANKVLKITVQVQ